MKVMKNKILKTCPFCGKLPSEWNYGLGSWDNQVYRVGCNNDLCLVKPQVPAKASAQEARDAWNKRTIIWIEND